MTDRGELTYASFAIEKVESTPDGDLLVYGKATDGSVDHDQQIVDPTFSAKAIADWLATGGNVRVQHNPQLYPAGKGIEINSDGDGATWVKTLVVEDTAKKLVSKGILRAYSVGIANPTIERDMTGKARGGIIKNGKIVEISLVDRPANASCGIRLVKSADVDHDWTFGNDAIAKALNVDKTSYGDAVNNIDTFQMPEDISLNFTPNDLFKIMQEKMAIQTIAEAEVYALKNIDPELAKDHREFSTDRRRALAGSGNALPDGSYPIPDKDALRRAAILARSGHGNVGAARRLIARRAKELGVSNPLDSNDQEKLVTGDDAIVKGEDELLKAAPPMDADEDDDDDDDCTAKEAEPVITKDPADGDACPPGKKPKKGKKMPPWLNKPADGDNSKFSDPKSASGAEEPCDMQSAPCDGEPLESPKPDHMKAAALLRYKTIGIDSDLGALHDFTCAAFHPDEVSKYHPGTTVASLIDVELWQRKALSAATGKSISEAQGALQLWQAAQDLKSADPDDLTSIRLNLFKAFRDANPGPTSFPSPGAMSPQKYKRPLITDGHSATSGGHSGPNTSATVANSMPSASHFDRPPLSSAHQSPSPSFMKGEREDYATETGMWHQITDGEIHREKARRALSMMHDHLIHMFPSICPVDDKDAYRVEQPRPSLPTPAGMSKAAAPEPEEVLGDVSKYIAKLTRKVQSGEITEAEARNRLAKKTAENYARKLAKQIEDGLTSKDAVLRALGIEAPEPAQKSAGGFGTVGWQGQPVEPPVQKAVTPEVSGLTPDVMKTMMSEILQPFQAKLDEQSEYIQKQNELLGAYQNKFETQQKELDEHNARWEALANQPDPSTAVFNGLGINPLSKSQPAAVAKIADYAEQSQSMMMRQLERMARTSENPSEREAARTALNRMQGHE